MYYTKQFIKRNILNICYNWNKTECTVHRVINEYILDVISSNSMPVLELYHATAHMQAKLVTLSLKRGIGIVLIFQNISDLFFDCTT